MTFIASLLQHKIEDADKEIARNKYELKKIPMDILELPLQHSMLHATLGNGNTKKFTRALQSSIELCCYSL